MARAFHVSEALLAQEIRPHAKTPLSRSRPYVEPRASASGLRRRNRLSRGGLLDSSDPAGRGSVGGCDFESRAMRSEWAPYTTAVPRARSPEGRAVSAFDI